MNVSERGTPKGGTASVAWPTPGEHVDKHVHPHGSSTARPTLSSFFSLEPEVGAAAFSLSPAERVRLMLRRSRTQPLFGQNAQRAIACRAMTVSIAP